MIKIFFSPKTKFILELMRIKNTNINNFMEDSLRLCDKNDKNNFKYLL